MMPDVRPIDANALKESVRKVPVFRTYDAGPPDLRTLVDLAPTLDYAPVMHGEWVEGMFCSNCRQVDLSKPNVCPNCGAMMDGGKEDEAD